MVVEEEEEAAAAGAGAAAPDLRFVFVLVRVCVCVCVFGLLVLEGKPATATVRMGEKRSSSASIIGALLRDPPRLLLRVCVCVGGAGAGACWCVCVRVASGGRMSSSVSSVKA